METTQTENRPSLVLGAALLLVAAFFIVFAKDIPRTGLAGNTDPGPRALPLAMASVVAAGGMIELIRGAVKRKQPGGAVSSGAVSSGAVSSGAVSSGAVSSDAVSSGAVSSGAVSITAAPATRADTGLPGSISYTKFGVLAAGMFVYLLSLSWLGFQVGTVLFTSAILMWLGARWWSAILSGLVIVMIVRVLFVGLFHVQLPAGSLGLAF